MVIDRFSLKGKRLLITGASSGIGRQIAVDCSHMGAHIVIMGRDPERLEETLSLLEGNVNREIALDLTNFEPVEKSLLQIFGEDGAFDGFVHCAGIEKTLLLKNFKSRVCLDIYKTNFISGVEILKLLTKKGNYNPGFKTVFISSITASIARVGTLIYTASKGAMVSAVRELAVELAPKKINVNSVSPGTVLTPMMKKYLEGLNEEERKKRLSGYPLGIGSPKDISGVVSFLLSDAARWITGQNIVVDGGYAIQ